MNKKRRRVEQHCVADWVWERNGGTMVRQPSNPSVDLVQFANIFQGYVADLLLASFRASVTHQNPV